MRHRLEIGIAVVCGLTAWGCAESFVRSEPVPEIVDVDWTAPLAQDSGLADAEHVDAGQADTGPGAPPTLRPVTPPMLRHAWVTDARHNRVMVVDLESETLVDEVAVGAMPRPIAASPDGRTVYVGNNTDGTISVIDVSRREVTRTIALEGRFANAMAMHPAGGVLYTATSAGLLEVDLQGGTVGRLLPEFGPSAGIAASPDGLTLYAATDFNSTALAIVDVAGFFVRETLDEFGGIARVSFGPEGDLFVADERAGSVAVVDTAFDEVVRRISVPGAPFAVAVTRDESALLIGHDQDAPRRMDLVGLDGVEAHDVWDLPSGAGAVPSVRAGAGGLAYAAGFLTGEVFVLDTRTSRVVTRIATAGAPFDLVLVP